MSIGKRIKQTRMKRKLTQHELAKRLGVVTTTVASWEQERNMPPITAINKLAEALSVSTNYLIGTEKIEKPKTADLADDDVLFTYQGKPLSEEDKAIIKRLMNGKQS